MNHTKNMFVEGVTEGLPFLVSPALAFVHETVPNTVGDCP